MFDDVHSALLNSLHKCKRAGRLYIGVVLESFFFEECIRAVKRDLVLDLYFSETIIQQIEASPFILNKLFDLRTNGANIYTTNKFDHLTNVQCICQADFQYTYILTTENNCNETDSLTYESIFSTISNESPEYRSELSDMQILITVDSDTVFKGKTTTIFWEVTNAVKISIDGFGEVSNQGKKSVQIFDDTIVILRAFNKKQSKFKAISLRAVESLQINYDIQFFNPASKQFVSLKNEENFEGVFGVSKGHKIKLIWNVENADNVEIKPFELSTKTGEYIFSTEGTIEINIKATLQGKGTNQRIIIHEFPMPVFTEKLVDIKEDFTTTVQLNIMDLRQQAYNYINNNNILNRQKSTEELRFKIEAQEKELMDVYKRINFNEFYKDHSVEKLNKNIISRLKSYFNNKPEVIEMINLLYKNHNE